MSGLRTIARFLLMRRHRSKSPTGILPMEEVRSAVVFRDPKEPCPDRDIKRFFDSYNIPYRIISEFDRDVRSNEDLFISITAKTSVSERYAASSSRARFKVGRRPVGHNVYDIVLTNPGELYKSESVAFAAICDFLRMVR